VGVALFPDDGHDVPTLLRKADAAMYAMKVALGPARESRKPR
jgi:GGDEF domain-containing protein